LIAELTVGELFGWVVALLGVLAFLSFVAWRVRLLRLHRRGFRVLGEVVSIKEFRGDEGTSYRALMSYPDHYGRDTESKLSVDASVKVGDRVQLLVDSAKPKRTSRPETLEEQRIDRGVLAFGKGWIVWLLWGGAAFALIVTRYGDPVGCSRSMGELVSADG
jgi:hypothetical protein